MNETILTAENLKFRYDVSDQPVYALDGAVSYTHLTLPTNSRV